MSERSEFGASRLNRAPQGIQRIVLDGEVAEAFLVTFSAEKVTRKSPRSWQRNAFELEFKKLNPINKHVKQPSAWGWRVKSRKIFCLLFPLKK